MDIRDSLFSYANPDSYVPQEVKQDSAKQAITKEQFKKFAPAVADADVTIIVNAINASTINTALRVAHFLAQAAHESTLFTRTVESTNYSADGLAATFSKYFPTPAIRQEYARKPERIANRAYANRNGNGSEASRDGYLYRGRGFLQLTGKKNYREYSVAVYKDERIVTNPELVGKTLDAILSSIWYWETNGLNKWADKDDGLTVGRVVNVGKADTTVTPNGYADRVEKLASAKKILGVK